MDLKCSAEGSTIRYSNRGWLRAARTSSSKSEAHSDVHPHDDEVLAAQGIISRFYAPFYKRMSLLSWNMCATDSSGVPAQAFANTARAELVSPFMRDRERE